MYTFDTTGTPPTLLGVTQNRYFNFSPASGTADFHLNDWSMDFLHATKSFTIAFWFRANDTTADMSILDSWITANSIGMNVSFKTTDTMNISVGNSGNTILDFTGSFATADLSDKQWHFVAFVGNGTTVSMFIDNEEASATGSYTGAVNTAHAQQYFGIRTYTTPDFDIADLIVYDGPLNTDELASLRIALAEPR